MENSGIFSQNFRIYFLEKFESSGILGPGIIQYTPKIKSKISINRTILSSLSFPQNSLPATLLFHILVLVFHKNSPTFPQKPHYFSTKLGPTRRFPPPSGDR